MVQMAAGKLEVTTVIRSKRSEKLWVVGEEDNSEWLSPSCLFDSQTP